MGLCPGDRGRCQSRLRSVRKVTDLPHIRRESRAAAARKEEETSIMRKAVALRVPLWIEGEDEPAHNFAESTKQAVREILEAGSTTHPELSITIQDLVEHDND